MKKQRHYYANKGLSSQSYGFSSSHLWMWELNHKESWAPKNWCFWTVVLQKTLESPSDCKEIKPIHLKGNQSWIFIGRTDIEAEAEAPILWPLDAYSLKKTLMLGKIEGKGRRVDKGWDGWMASLTQWTWVWTSSGSWWLTGEPDVLQSTGSQRVGHDWVTELNWTDTVKGFSIVNEAEVDAFLESPCFFCDQTDVGNLMSGSSAFSKLSLHIRKFFVHILLKPSFKDFERYLPGMWNECICAVVWTFFGIALF